MLRIGVASFLLLLITQSCKSNPSELAEAVVDCSDASHLERVLSLLAPNEVTAQRRDCLIKNFQRSLDQERDATQDKKENDRFDAEEMVRSSSRLRGYSYTRENIFDRKAYIKGPAIFNAHRRLIAEAQEEVLLQTYVWESQSASAREVMEGLKDLQVKHSERQKQCSQCGPVVVRILANYGPTLPNLIADVLGGEKAVDYGADARTAIQALGLDPKVLDIQVLTYEHKAFGTNHVKSLVVDGQIAMVTGANVQRFNDADVNWFDVGYMMGGAIAKGLRVDLINNLIRAGAGTEKDGDEKLAQGLRTEYEKAFKTIYPIMKMMEKPLLDPLGIPAVISGRNGNGVPSSSNNNTQNRTFQAVFQGARKWIRVQTPNLNDDAAIRAMGAAVRRGVKLEMILSKLFNCASENQVGQGGQNEKGALRLLREFSATTPQGTLYDIRWFSMLKDGQPVRVVDNVKGKKPEERPNNSHAKFLTVDDELAVIGSANMDTQSWNQSRELNVLVFHPEVVKAWQEQVFDANFAIAQAVTPAEVQEANIKCDMKE
jgi:phosphatidylserine/phosphatidylglycerophosphate/cardiolipin synthase-like enzyme